MTVYYIPPGYDLPDHAARLSQTSEAKAALADLAKDGATIQPDEFAAALGTALKTIHRAHIADAVRDYENGIGPLAIEAAVARLRIPKAD